MVFDLFANLKINRREIFRFGFATSVSILVEYFGIEKASAQAIVKKNDQARELLLNIANIKNEIYSDYGIDVRFRVGNTVNSFITQNGNLGVGEIISDLSEMLDSLLNTYKEIKKYPKAELKKYLKEVIVFKSLTLNNKDGNKTPVIGLVDERNKVVYFKVDIKDENVEQRNIGFHHEIAHIVTKDITEEEWLSRTYDTLGIERPKYLGNGYKEEVREKYHIAPYASKNFYEDIASTVEYMFGYRWHLNGKEVQYSQDEEKLLNLKILFLKRIYAKEFGTDDAFWEKLKKK